MQEVPNSNVNLNQSQGPIPEAPSQPNTSSGVGVRPGKSFSGGEALRFGWVTFKSNWKFLLVVIFVIIAVSFGLSFLTALLEKAGATPAVFLLNVLGFIVNMLLGMGVFRIVLRFIDREKPEYSDLYSQYDKLVKYFITSLLYILIVVGGFFLLIIPGVIWWIKYQYALYLVVDKGLGPMEAIKQSGKITNGVKIDLFFFNILMMLVMFTGVLALGVGLLIALPVVFLAQAYVYRKLLHQTFTVNV